MFILKQIDSILHRNPVRIDRRIRLEEESRRQDYVWCPCLGQGSDGVAVEQHGTGELTDGGGVRGGDEEDSNEKLVEEHGDAGGGPV